MGCSYRLKALNIHVLMTNRSIHILFRALRGASFNAFAGLLLGCFSVNAIAQAVVISSATTPQMVQVKTVIWANSGTEKTDALLEKIKPGLIGRRIDSAQLTQIEAALTKDLRAEGYLIGQVVVSSQDYDLFVKTGDLRLSVYLGKVGQITVKNSSSVDTAWVDSVVMHAICPNGVGETCVLTQSKFERMTQLLQDTTGLQTGALDFSAEGMPIGQAKLIVTTIAKHSQVKGSVGLDNQGFSSTGLYRMGATLSANNLFGVGDVFALNAFTSNQGAVSGALNLSGPIASNGLRWQSSLSRSQFAVPGVSSNGFGNAASVGLAYPLVRSLDANWIVGLNAVGVATNSQVSGVVMTDKTLKSGQLTLDGNSGDRSISLGQNSWYAHVDLTKGTVSDAGASSAFLSPYTKLAFQGIGRLLLNEKYSIYSSLSVRGQVANTNLDPYEKLLIGGFSGMRAYSQNQGSFNQGTISTIDLRQVIDTAWGQFVPAIFLDYANGWTNRFSDTALNSGLSNHMVLSDAGLGIDWRGFDNFSLSASWARRLPMSPAGLYNTSNANSQFWFLAQASF